jgi:hypothetical protein
MSAGPAALEGKLDPFIEAYLKWKAGQQLNG